ncbi:S-adenosyl-L-methionine-dependent methyltransferase [Xylaria nigripes]|nr:S-adenosyl-L-methionine-dependent methyltransferase [Xylaria nigripes]
MDPGASAVPENLKGRMKESYDAIANVYNEWTKPHHKHRMLYLEKALSQLDGSEGLDILELGCGAGLPVTKELLSHPGAKVVANDLSDTQLALAKQNLVGTTDNDGIARRLQLVQGDMSSLDFASASFDLVVAFYSIIHLPREEQTALFGRVAQWLKPGGYLVANFSKAEMDVFILPDWLDDKGWMFWSGWGAEGTLGRIKRAGFDVVVADVVEDPATDATDASFLWVIARR